MEWLLDGVSGPACAGVRGITTNMSDILDGIDQRLELTLLLEEGLRRKRERKIGMYFPDEGPLRRECTQST